jgi:hypothetical protein
MPDGLNTSSSLKRSEKAERQRLRDKPKHIDNVALASTVSAQENGQPI